jgi:hypothetical protein
LDWRAALAIFSELHMPQSRRSGTGSEGYQEEGGHEAASQQ